MASNLYCLVQVTPRVGMKDASSPAWYLAAGCALGAAATFLVYHLREGRKNDAVASPRVAGAGKSVETIAAVDTPIGPNTRYIISTSGRISSMRRYKHLLRDILKVDIAYIVINTGGEEGDDDKPTRKIAAIDFCDAIRGLKAIGGAISKDIKGTVLHELDKVDNIAQAVGAVNTIVREEDRLVGYNTDAEGFKIAIVQGIQEYKRSCKPKAPPKSPASSYEARIRSKVKSCVCYGYGGVTAVVVAVLKSMGIEVYITGRRLEVAKTRARELGVSTFDKSNHKPDLFVNAAPVTDFDSLEKIPNFLEALSTCRIAFDHELVGQTLVDHCKRNGIFHIPGRSMYWPQMMAQWRLFLKGIVPEKKLVSLRQLLEKADKMAQDDVC